MTTTDITISNGNQTFDKRQIAIMQRTVANGTSPEEFAFFLEVCKYRGLNPFNREIYAIVRQGRMTIQIGIDGLRKLAERSGKYKGQKGPYFCGPDGVWKEEWLLSTPPTAAKIGVIRADFEEPIWAVARYDAYAQLDRDGKPTAMWAKYHDVLLAKCCESLAIRRAFPAECGGMYSHEEMMQADSGAGNVVVGSVSPLSDTLNAIYERGVERGIWQKREELFPFIEKHLGVTVTRQTIYDLTQEQLEQLLLAVEEAQASAE
jgi:phage recombination protein Bet